MSESPAPVPSDEPGLGPTIVGIGASAGGLAALKTFFAYIPEDSGLAYVVVVHLSPEHESHLADLLQPHVKMPVCQVTETVAVKPNHVYVIPPGANLSAVDTHLRPSELEERRLERAPIDHFFRTLAKTHDGNSVAVVLTGTGADGTLGLREIKERAGLTVVQDPAEAEYDGMPQSAVATGLVDLVLPLAEIPGAILRVASTEPALRVADGEADPEGQETQFLGRVFAQIRTRTGRDFSRYKRSTLLRRIARRMQLHAIEAPTVYLEFLLDHPDEVRALADDLLINVTSFFRDPDVFEALARDVIPRLFKRKGSDDDIRAWSVGCATGEEAYSLAILLLEEAGRRDRPPPRLQVFASDLHERSLQQAREGFYPGDIAADVSAERLKQFFKQEDGGYRIRKAVRELVVFAPHNLLGDPPFSKLDLVACRNVLIYLQRDVQQDIIDLFHYALRPEGWLVVGTSETVDKGDLFRVASKAHSLYQKRNVQAPDTRLPVFKPTHRQPSLLTPSPAGSAEPLAYGVLHRQMAEAAAPPSLLLSPNDKVVHLSEEANRYLLLPGGEVTASVFKLVREELRVELRAALHASRKSGAPVRSEPLAVRFDGGTARVVLDVRPAAEPHASGFALVVFDEYGPVPEAPDGAAEVDGERVREVQAELDLARQRLEAILEEYETSREEMKASNEELQSANEELRSTMEELETSKEELQSLNEELQTVNQENRHKVAELTQLSGDLQNLLTATDIATLYLDRDLRILRFTPRVKKLFNIRPVDRGRPFTDLTHRLGYDALADDAAAVVERLAPVEREVQDADGEWYLTRVLPYRSAEDRIEGVVITFVEITERKHAEEEAREAQMYAESIIQTLHEPLLVLTPDLHVRTANTSFFEHFQVSPDYTIGRLIYDLGNAQWDIPELRTLLEDVLPDDNVFTDYEVSHEFEEIGERVMLLNARRLDHVQLVLLGIRDVTERKRAEWAVRESEARFRQLADTVPDAVFTAAPDGTVDYVNPQHSALTGVGPDEVVGSPMWHGLVHPDDRPATEATWAEARRSEERFEARYRVRDMSEGDRDYCWVIARARPVFDDDGALTQWFGTITDVDALARAEAEVRELNETLEARVEARTAQVRELARALTLAEQDERRRIAHVLHDDLQPTLAGAQIAVAQTDLDRLEGILGQAIETARTLSHELSPPLLRGDDLAGLLDWLVTRKREEYGLQIELDTGGGVSVPEPDLRILLYQILRELLFNVVKHAGTDAARISAERFDDRIRLVVEDEGAGFDPAALDETPDGGLGLPSVRERIELVGGTLEVVSAPGDGTRVTMEIPSRSEP